MFFSGISIFLMSIGEFLTQHDTWTDLTSPSDAGHLLLITGSFVATIVGALGTSIRTGRHTRSTDRVDLNRVEPRSLDEN